MQIENSERKAPCAEPNNMILNRIVLNTSGAGVVLPSEILSYKKGNKEGRAF